MKIKRKNALFIVNDGLCVRVKGPPPALYLRFLRAYGTLDGLNDARGGTSVGIPGIRVYHG